MKRRQHTRANRNGQGALLEELRGMHKELRSMRRLLVVWECNGMPTERVELLPPDAAAAVEETFGKPPAGPAIPFESSQGAAGREDSPECNACTRYRFIEDDFDRFACSMSEACGRSPHAHAEEQPAPSRESTDSGRR